jgi:ABC-type dipeptide/oligopeptide/nickel transport system permease component
MEKVLLKTIAVLLISLFVIFFILHSFEENSLLKLKYGNNVIFGFIYWGIDFIQLKWGVIHSTGQKLVAFGGEDNDVNVLGYLCNTLIYGLSGLTLAVILSSFLTYMTVFKNNYFSKSLSYLLNILSGIHIILFCFLLKIILGHQEGFHFSIILLIAIASYSFSDIYQFQLDQFNKLHQADFITAARAWGDSVFVHARRTIFLGVLSIWNSSMAIIFTSTIMVEYFFKIRGVGYAIDRYLIRPNLNNPTLSVESYFLMVISALVIFSILFISGIKDILNLKLSKGIHS